MTTPITRGQTSLGFHYPGTDDPVSGIAAYIQQLAEDIDSKLSNTTNMAVVSWYGTVQTPTGGNSVVVTLPGVGKVYGAIVRPFGPNGTTYCWNVGLSRNAPYVGQTRLYVYDSTRAIGSINPGVFPPAGETCELVILAWGDKP